MVSRHIGKILPEANSWMRRMVMCYLDDVRQEHRFLAVAATLASMQKYRQATLHSGERLI
jgi:hypothetical protein